MQLACGVLEQQYDRDIDLETARRIAVRAVDSASERDTASGNGVTIATITREGVETEAYAAATEVA